MRIPFFDAIPIPLKKLRGIYITKAHGQDITKNINALYIQVEKVAPAINKGGNIPIKKAVNTTIGV